MAPSSSASLPPRDASSSSLALPSLAAHDLARVRAPLNRAWTLPPRAYTDPAVYEREDETIFRRDWICVAHVDQLPDPPGHLAVQLHDHPIVITRDETGRIRALSNVCLHRAMPLTDGAGTGRWMVCPYHQWSYGLDGGLHTAPMMEGASDFDMAECRLPSLAVEVWEGLVFVSLAPQPAPLAAQLEPLRRQIANYRLADLTIAHTIEFDSPWNWKLLVENFMEAYHHIGPHRDTFQLTNPAARSHVVDNEGGPWSLLRMPGNTDLDESPDLPFLPGLEREQRADLLAFCVFPYTLVATTGTLATWYQLVPHAHDRMTLRIHILLDADVAADPATADALGHLVEGVSWIHGEDIPVNEGPWRGLHSPLATQGRLSPYEAAIWQLNQLWIDRVT
jgi:phenylpropionate dioxygenase-like ring-hydroxylating dioxygenase large terminal subunit